MNKSLQKELEPTPKPSVLSWRVLKAVGMITVAVGIVSVLFFPFALVGAGLSGAADPEAAEEIGLFLAGYIIFMIATIGGGHVVVRRAEAELENPGHVT